MQPLKTLKLPQRTLHILQQETLNYSCWNSQRSVIRQTLSDFFLLGLPPIITSLCYVSLCCSHLILPKIKPTVPFPSCRAALMSSTHYRCTETGAVRSHCRGLVRYNGPSELQSYALPKSRHADFPQINSSGWDKRTRTCREKNLIKRCS